MTSLRQKLLSGRSQPARGAASPISEALFSALSPIQQQFVKDAARYKIARCTRRAGKTYAIAAYMILECIAAAHTPVLYAGLTRDSAKEAVWPILVELLERFGIPHNARESALQIDFPNKSKITIFGCDTENARNRLRGRKFKLVCFDETGFYAKLDPLVYAVLPMLADLGGTLCLTSSPGELLEGLFYEADQGKFKDSWSRYFWSIHDNPLFQKPAINPKFKTRADEELGTVLELQFAGKTDHPDYVREWLGQWVADFTTLVYPVEPRNILPALSKLPEQEHAIGLSFSAWVNGIAIGRYSPSSRDFQIVATGEYEDLTVDKFARRVQLLVQVYKPTVIVADTGDYSKDILNELRRRYDLPVVAGDKKDIAFHQRIFATDLKKGHIKILQGLPILERYGKIVKGPDGDEIAGQANYAPNAALALYRRVYQTHLQSYVAPLSTEDQHIKQLEASREDDDIPWYEQIQ